MLSISINSSEAALKGFPQKKTGKAHQKYPVL